MPKTLYTSVQGLEPFGGVKPVGVQVRVKGGTGPYVPRFIDEDEGVILLLECKRGDLTLKHLEDNPVIRIDLDATEILEVTDKDTAYELIRAMRSERDRAISVASGYDGTTTGPNGETVHADGDGTVLTDAEVAAMRGAVTGATLEEAKAWWEEQHYVDGPFDDVSLDQLLELVGRLPLNEVEYVELLDVDLCSAPYESRHPEIVEAIRARMDDLAEAASAPGWSPIEAGVSIAETRRRLGEISDVRVVEGLLTAESAGKNRKRVRQALDDRLAQLAAAEPAGAEPADVVPAGPAVDEEPFG